MRATTTATMLVTAGLVLAGCSVTSTENPTPVRSSTSRGPTRLPSGSPTTGRGAGVPLARATTLNPPPAVATTLASPSVLPTVLPEKEQEYLLKVEDAAPLLTNDDLRAVELGYGICSRTKAEWPEEAIRAWLRLTAPPDQYEDPVLSDEQANNIIAAARGYLCP